MREEYYLSIHRRGYLAEFETLYTIDEVGLKRISKIAVDWISQNIYFIVDDKHNNYNISALDLTNGGEPKVIVQIPGFSMITGIAVYPSKG